MTCWDVYSVFCSIFLQRSKLEKIRSIIFINTIIPKKFIILNLTNPTMLHPIRPFHLSLPSIYSISPFLLSITSIHRIPWRHRCGHQPVIRYHLSIRLKDNNSLHFRKMMYFSKSIQPIITQLKVEFHTHRIFVSICYPAVTLPCRGVQLICSKGINLYFIPILHCIIYKVISSTLSFKPLIRIKFSFRKVSHSFVFRSYIHHPISKENLFYQ